MLNLNLQTSLNQSVSDVVLLMLYVLFRNDICLSLSSTSIFHYYAHFLTITTVANTILRSSCINVVTYWDVGPAVYIQNLCEHDVEIILSSCQYHPNLSQRNILTSKLKIFQFFTHASLLYLFVCFTSFIDAKFDAGECIHELWEIY